MNKKKVLYDWWLNSGEEEEQPIDFLYIIGGQSNAGTDDTDYGRVDYADMPAYLSAAQSNVHLYNVGTDAFAAFTHPNGQQWGFQNELLYREAARLGRTIYFFKHSLGGSRLSDITTSGALYTRRTLFTNADAAITKFLTFAVNPCVVFVFTHGYTDAIVDQTSQDYEENLKDFFAQCRERWDIPNLHIFYERLHSGTNPSFKANVRTAQANVDALSIYNHMIDSDAWALNADGAHYTGPGSITGGQAFSAAIAAANLTATEFGERAWLPMDLNPYFWFDAARVDPANTQLEIRDSGGQKFIKRWIDQYSGYNVVQSTTARQPELINGGTSSAYLLCDLARSLVSTDGLTQGFCTNDFEFFWFLSQIDDGQPGAVRMIFESDAATNSDIFNSFLGTGNLMQTRLKNVTDKLMNTNAAPFADGVIGSTIINGRVSYTGNAFTLFINDVQQTLAAGNNGDLTGFDRTNFLPGVWTVVNRDTYSATTGFAGRLRAMIVIPRILTSDERALLLSYYQ